MEFGLDTFVQNKGFRQSEIGHMRRIIQSITLMLFLVLAGIAVASPQSGTSAPVELELFSTARAESVELPLSDEDWRYLRRKGELLVGVTEPGLPPLEVAGSTDFKGITADVSTLLGEQLHVKVRILLYATRSQALNALHAGEIDLLSGASTLRDASNSIVLSTPYAHDILAIYRRPQDTRTYGEDLAGAKIAITDGYIDEKVLKGAFPNARFQTYGSAGQAMAAAAFGEADLYLGDTLTARYHINHSYFNYIKIERLLEVQSDGYGFAIDTSNTTLRRAVNTALHTLGKAKLDSLSRRWVGGGYDIPETELKLTRDEETWLAEHPTVTLAISDDQAPVAFVDREGNFNGIAADVLDLVAQRTGLRFEIKRIDNSSSLISGVIDGKADLSILSRTPERDAFMRFTPRFMTSTFVLVSREAETAQARRLRDLQGKRLAITKGHACYKAIAAKYPDIQLIETATSLDSMREVAAGRADAAVTSLIRGRYYISKLFEDTLVVSGIVDNDTAVSNFGMRRSDVELQSILSKVILDIPPEEMNSIASRWRPNPAMTGQTWLDHREVIFAIILASIAMIGVFVIWALILRLQIARRRGVEKSLNDRLQYIQILGDATPHPVYVRDRELKLTDASRSYEEAVGVSLDALVGKTVIDGSSKFGAAHELHSAYQKALERNEPIRARRLVYINGERRWLDHWIQPYHDASGMVQGLLCGWMDVTEQQQLTETMESLVCEVEQARERAEQISREKTNFLATMSHEIRTPLSAVIGTLELVQRQADEGKLDRPGIQVAHASAKGLQVLIGDVLDIVRIESGRLSLSPMRANVRDLVESVALVFEGLARQKGLSLALDLDLDANMRGDVLIDPTRFKQILSNLVSNAIKFTTSGSVTIAVQGRAQDDARVHLEVAVMDTGIGISREDQERLFHPFTQLRKANSDHGGAGLGLAISRSLCELMGGNLNMRSAPSKGTTVTASFVLHHMDNALVATVPDAGQTVSNPAPLERQSLQVLVVDDYGIHRRLLCQQLEFLGHRPTAAERGERALELWRAGWFDVVITDCQMPGIQGTDLAKAIRCEEAASDRSSCVILGLTADAQPEELARSLAAGMNGCTVKPMGLDALRDRLSTIKSNGHVSPFAQSSECDIDTHEMPDTALRGIEALRAVAGSNRARRLALVRETIKAMEDALQKLDQLEPRAHESEIALLAHQLLGVGRMLNHAELVRCCIALQNAGTSQSPLTEEIVSQMQDLKSILTAMCDGYLQYLTAAESEHNPLR
ncbi:transporter substrate-binding domain-containing protein [Paraburkholderia sp. Ac-20342]|uniref:transporter substrate-binding domain-containing protein n=1 Tax=Paraburkholderia sp. Ac-20342 TaxID=2703889 RepID=UPI001F121C19|nr:transporter substrate-binding domain-containing protein [Paraburkholderia sp. Ac-20342]